jgi:GT2 family glycosyltransferase
MPETRPVRRCRVVVLNYDGGELTLRCLRSVLAHRPPGIELEVVLVDNASVDGIDWIVREELPEVRLVSSSVNRGFAGGCNLGMRDLGIPGAGGVDAVALLNNDAFVEGDWITPLAAELERDPRVAAACPKMLFAQRQRWLELRTVASPAPGGDRRSVGVAMSGVRLDGVELDAEVAFDEGWWHREPGDPGVAFRRWTRARAGLRIPAELGGSVLSLRLQSLGDRTLTVVSAAGAREVTVGTAPVWVDVDLGDDVVDIVNNVGSGLFAGGYGGDRGFLEIDRGQFDDGAEVFAWCGGAVLLRADYLRSVGVFDERLFLYYEDTDLSWRGRHAGWVYRAVPASVVRHEHAATSGGVTSPVFLFHVTRNRPLVLVKNAPAAMARAAVSATVREARHVAWRELRSGPHRLRRVRRAPAVRAAVSMLRLLPAMLRDRRRIRRRSVFDDATLAGWTMTKPDLGEPQ